MSKFTPSKYQKDIFNFIKNGTENAIISAVAGSGKTTTLVKALEQIPSNKTVLFLAFNKSIADELKVRVPQTSNITVKTVHGFGYSVLRNQFEVEIDNKKYGKMLKDIISFHTNKTKSSIEKYKFDKTHLGYISKMASAVKTDEGDNKDFFGDVINLTNLGRLHLIDTEIKLKVSGREEQYLVSLDSRVASVKNESILTIRKTPFHINMVEIPEETFLKTLRNKLLWGEDKRN